MRAAVHLQRCNRCSADSYFLRDFTSGLCMFPLVLGSILGLDDRWLPTPSTKEAVARRMDALGVFSTGTPEKRAKG